MRQEQSVQLATSIVEFCRYLRTYGFSADTRQTMSALEAARTIVVTNRQFFLSALQATLCSNREEWEQFPQVFQAFWAESQPRPRSASGEYNGPSKGNSQEQQGSSSVFLDRPGNQCAAQDGTSKAAYGASAQQRLKKVDFSELPGEDLKVLEEISLRLLRRMSLRLSRRLAYKNRACRIDLRRTIRRSIAHGGEPIVLVHKGKESKRNKLVILLDISGSMNFYSLFLVRFAYALQGHFERVHTFLFSTDVVEISDLLRTPHLPDALRRLSKRAAGWSGGTRIGESLRQFNQNYGRRLLSRDAVFIILSDGWDTGEPALLAAQLRATKRRVQKVLWLNPLLGLKGYQPLTQGMTAALPYVDVFAPAHNLESLLALERYL
ncbi:MAG: VWA domain-containing protein [Acidobacteriaceae bacterium]|jgi:uncharacterized protein with von Willebrand factor type A (vWA) domain